MKNTNSKVESQRRIALIAEDNKRQDLLAWMRFNYDVLAPTVIYAPESTGKLLEQELRCDIRKLQSGFLNGDPYMDTKIAEGDIDFIIFFWDPLEPQPHDPDVKAILQFAEVWNIPILRLHS
jgi:methylglyoxal synthase